MLVAAPGGDAGAARLLRRGARARADRRARAAGRRSTSRSATPSRSSTSAPRRAASTARRPGCCAARAALRHACRWPSSPRPRRALARDGRRGQRPAGLPVRDPRADRRGARRSRARCFMPDGPAAARGRACIATRSSPTRSSGSAAEGAGAVLRGRHRRGGRRTGSRERGGTLDARRPRRLRARSPREPVRVALPRPRGAAPTRRRAPAGSCIAYALALLERGRGAAGRGGARRARWRRAQAERTPAFLDGLAEPGLPRARSWPRRLGSTTHISVLDADGWACAVTCTNGEGSGIVVPGTGIHVNNMMGEQDLSPLGLLHATRRGGGCRR